MRAELYTHRVYLDSRECEWKRSREKNERYNSISSFDVFLKN